MKIYGALMGLCLVILSLVPAPVSAAPDIKPFVRGSYQQLIAARQGRPFMVNFWSLSCTHCQSELAMFKKLARKYPKLDLVLVSTDTTEEEKLVAATLEKIAPANAETWLFADSYIERLRYEVDKRWHGELPRTYFFGANNEVKAFSGRIEEHEIERWIKTQYGS